MPGCNVLKIGGLGQNNYYALMAKEFRALGVHVPINTLINTGSSGWWGRFSQADVVRLADNRTFAAFEGADLAGLGQQLAWMRSQFPNHNPLVNFEYYSGWIDLEGHAHPNPRAPTVAAYAAGLDQQLASNLSVSLYMAVVSCPTPISRCGNPSQNPPHASLVRICAPTPRSLSVLRLQGGTNFGFMGGGEWEGGRSTPIIASYDYAAPITEGGDIGPKFLPLQSVIRKHFPSTTPPPPPAGAAPIPKQAYGTVVFDSEAPLFENLAHFNTSVLTAPQNMEVLGQNFGWILYTMHLPDGGKASPVLVAPGLADRGLAYLGSELQGVIGTWVPAHSLTLSGQLGKGAALRVLVSNEGRQSGELMSLARNSKGLLGSSAQPATCGGAALGAMNATHLALPEPASAWADSLGWRPAGGSGGHAPTFYRGTLTAAGGEATFLVMDGWGHGVVFVNDVNVGRFSCLGPVRTLYVPTGVLIKGKNSIYIFETDRLGVTTKKSARTVTSVAAGPLWMNRTQLAAAAAARVVLKSDELPCPFGSNNSIPRSARQPGVAGG